MDDFFDKMLAPAAAAPPRAAPPSSSSSSSSSSGQPRPLYIAAPRFDGRRPGYYFTRGDKGLGYYRDTAFVVKDAAPAPGPAAAASGGDAERKRKRGDENDDGDDDEDGGAQRAAPGTRRDAIEKMLEDAEAMGVNQVRRDGPNPPNMHARHASNRPPSSLAAARPGQPPAAAAVL